MGNFEEYLAAKHKRELFVMQPCSEGSIGFRELQCSSFDNKRISKRLWKWKPRYSQGKAIVCLLFSLFLFTKGYHSCLSLSACRW